MAWIKCAGVNEALVTVAIEASVADTCLGTISFVRTSGINVTWVGRSADIDMASSRVRPG